MLRMTLWPKMALHSTLIAVIFRHIIVKNILSSHISGITIQPPLLSNPEADSDQDIPSTSPQHESDPFEYFNPPTSFETIAHPKAKLHSPSTYHNLLPLL